MNVIVTGAGGFVGSVLVRQLLAAAQPLQVGQLTLVDRMPVPAADARVSVLQGDLCDAALLRQLADARPDVVFHLASVPGGAAEADYAAGRRVNLDATLALFETVAQARPAHLPVPVVVYASSIAVYGCGLRETVGPATPLRPPLSYGAHKLVCEVLLADFSRRGLLDGRSLRLPGIVARPHSREGLASAFMSDIIHALAAGRPFTCPVSADATAWWMSAQRCAENLVHAATMQVAGADSARAWPLPVLRLSMGELVQTLARIYGPDRLDLVNYAAQPALEAVFGQYPPLDDAAARALGLRDDGTPAALVRRALAQDVCA